MKVVEQGFEIETTEYEFELINRRLERIARTCYKSEGKIGPGSDEALLSRIIKNGHTAMIEHMNITVHFLTDRGVTHEFVRHRHCAFAQESTRYVNYKEGMEAVRPAFPWATAPTPKDFMLSAAGSSEEQDIRKRVEKYVVWKEAMTSAEKYYGMMVELGCSPQEARSVLPNSLKTELWVTASVREWRSIFELRVAKGAHPQIRTLLEPVLKIFAEKVPVLFADLL